MSYGVFLTAEFNLHILVEIAWRYSNSKYFFSNFDVTIVSYFPSLSLLTKTTKLQKCWKWAGNVTNFQKNSVNFSFWWISMEFLHNVVLHKHYLKNIFWKFSYPCGARHDQIRKIKGKNDLCPDLTHGFQVLYLRSPLKKLWYIYIFPITKMDKVGDKTFTT